MDNIINDLKNVDLLIVEDGQDIRDIMYSTLHKIFKNTRTAIDGVDGLVKFNDKQPDIVLSDIRMPNMSGNDMIEEMKRINPDIPIIVITGHGRLMKKNINADLILEKPIKFNRLVEEIHNLVQ
ncbi:MAG: response regulator [Campylobacterota bacterium]|nr:response regulator [Campylobacterota bacterium]